MKGQMLPIKSELKSKRIRWGAPQNQISWAFMKELRENNKTRKIYDINPYVEVYQFRDNMYGLFSENADGAGDVWMFLTIGPEKALLVDTSFGIGDLKGLVDEITGNMPLIVVNTHGHYDHAYGNCRFDKVYCHEYTVWRNEMQNSHMWDYLFDDFGECIWMEFDRKDLPTFKKYENIGVPDGYIFNLGNDYEVELVWTAGHASGHAMYLDKKNRILFTGDDICSDVSGVGGGPRPEDPYGQYCTITAYRNQLEKLVNRMDEFDYLFPAHFMVNLENSLLLDFLETCNAIVANPEDCDFKREKWPKDGPKMERRFKYVKGFSVIAYNPNGV